MVNIFIITSNVNISSITIERSNSTECTSNNRIRSTSGNTKYLPDKQAVEPHIEENPIQNGFAKDNSQTLKYGVVVLLNHQPAAGVQVQLIVRLNGHEETVLGVEDLAGQLHDEFLVKSVFVDPRFQVPQFVFKHDEQFRAQVVVVLYLS